MTLGWKKTLLYSLLPTLVLFALLEGAARVAEIWMPPLPVDYGWGFDPDSRVFIPSPADPGFLITNPSKEISFPKERFATPKPTNTFRVFMIGGSSVAYLQINLKLLAIVLASHFPRTYQFEIINAGALAYGSHRLTPVLAEVLNYQPDAILFYEAHNEFEEVEQLQLADLHALPLQKILYKSACCRFIRDRVAAITLSRIQRERNQRILSNPQADHMSGFFHKYTPGEMDQRMAAYRANLTIMAGLCQQHDVPFIIGTVPSNLWKPDLPDETLKQQVRELYDNGQFDAGRTLARDLLKTHPRHQSSDIENGIIRELAQRYNLPLAEVESAVTEAEPHHVPGETLFNDRCHLNAAGNQILIKVFQEHLEKIIRGKLRETRPAS